MDHCQLPYKKLNQISSLSQLPIPRVDQVLGSLGKGRALSLFDLASSCHQITAHKDTVSLTSFFTHTGLYEWLVMSQGSSASSGWFVKVISEVIKGLAQVVVYLDDVIVFDSDPTAHVKTMRAPFKRLRKHNLKFFPTKARLEAMDADCLGHYISPTGVCLNAEKKSASIKMLMPRDLNQVFALLGGMGYYRKFLRDLCKRIRPITSLFRKGVKVGFTSSMEDIVHEIIPELAAPPILVYPTGTPWTTAPAPSTCTATTASAVLLLRLNRSSRTAQCSPSLTSAALPSILRGTGQRLTWKLAALSGPLNSFEATSGARSFASSRITRRSRASASGKSQCASPAVASSFSPRSTAPSTTARAAPTEIPIFCPVCQSLARNTTAVDLVASPPWKIAVSSSSGPAGFAPVPCLLYTSPSPRDKRQSRMPSSA